MMTAISPQDLVLFEIDTEENRLGHLRRRTWFVRAADEREAMSFVAEGAAITSINVARRAAFGVAGVIGWVGDRLTDS